MPPSDDRSPFEQPAGHRLSRRALLATAALGMTAAGVPRTLNATLTPWQPVSPDLTPDQAMARLMDGNRRFVAGTATSPNRSMARLKEIAPEQRPFAAILSCADSRVPVELLFDQGFGDLFVVRVAGNIATPEEIASLEFGTLVLGAKALYVLGHSGCGAVKAAIAGTPVPGQISVLFQHLRPAVRAGGNDLAKATRENVKIQTTNLAESSPVLADLVKSGKLKIGGGVYQLETGAVTTVS